MTDTLGVAVLWHMHQPDYRDDATGRPRQPWARLHALHAYYDMIRLVREEPRARVVLNVVPSLLWQLADLARPDAPPDPVLALCRRDPADLDREERRRLLRDGFGFHHARRFAELPRLAELWERRGGDGRAVPPGAEERFTAQGLRDLQVLFHLAWCGRTLREDPLVAALLARGRDFTEAEKQALLDRQQAFLAGVLPAWREAVASGQVELSVTPLTHPILPLLCDTDAAREARPDLPLPQRRFQRPGDAWYHVVTALAEAERLLGTRPAGMWPAEGSLSRDAVRILAAAGVRWAAGDQGVLEGSLARAGVPVPPARHFQAWRWGGDGMPALFFRDTGLSDAIGFRFQSMPAAAAVAELVGHLENIRAALPEGGRYLVPLILDGENPWEYYPDSGVAFLQQLYAAVADHPHLEWRTFSDHLDGGGMAADLPDLRAGSWIRADFTTWIGHPEKNRAWDLLAAVRAACEPALQAAGVYHPVALPDGRRLAAWDPQRVGPTAAGDVARAVAALANAESSDWFWWFGDDNPTDFADRFDAQFRDHLAAACRLLGVAPPAAVSQPVRRPRKEPS